MSEKRTFVAADLHGDFHLLKSILAFTECISVEGTWVGVPGVSTTLVFLGDVVDGSRGSRSTGSSEEEAEMLALIVQMYRESRLVGDRVVWVCGNHDAGIPTLGASISCERYGPRDAEGCSRKRFLRIHEALRHSHAKIVATVHDKSVVLVHGGLSQSFVNAAKKSGIRPDQWNEEFRIWVRDGRGKNRIRDKLFSRPDAPYWSRPTNGEKRDETVRVAEKYFGREDGTVVLVGHTIHPRFECFKKHSDAANNATSFAAPQTQGAPGKFDSRLCFLDTGMSRAFADDNPRGVLVIEETRTRRGEKPTLRFRYRHL